MVLRGRGMGGQWEILLEWFFYWVVESDREWFWLSQPFESLTQHSVNIEHQVKYKLTWLVCTKSMKLKWTGVKLNCTGACLQLKMKFLLGSNMKIVI